MSGFEPELGQAVFSNGPWNELEAESHVIAGIDALAEIAAEGDPERLVTGNHGPAGNIDNGTFELRAYCWCDGEVPGHEEGCPPNFRYGDFQVRWYKHSHRSPSQNRPMPLDEWRSILAACLNSLEAEK